MSTTRNASKTIMAAPKRTTRKKTKAVRKAATKTTKRPSSSRPSARPAKVTKRRAPKKAAPRVRAKTRHPIKKKATPVARRRAPKVVHAKKGSPLTLSRFAGNPILGPSEHFWESKWTFNPSALLHDGKVHMVYRAVGGNDVSMVGYAESSDGYSVDARFAEPMFFYRNVPQGVQTAFKIPYSSGGGFCGGSEDPRVTRIDDRVYMLFTAFDGWSSIRIGLTWLSLSDFLNRVWKWKKPIFISPPNEVHKNWVLFPEKVQGKYAILHRIAPKVSVAYVDSLETLGTTTFIKSSATGKAPKRRQWDDWVRGAGPSPIKTTQGWLLLYHAMDTRDPNRYKLGAMLLDLKDPEKVLYRATQPILEPDEWYENEGFKAGVVYSCGAVVKDDLLFVYYGGADAVCCVAVADLKKFLRTLMTSGAPKLARANAKR